MNDNERLTKTRDGNSSHLRAFAAKMFANKVYPERCPVKIYKEYRARRPPTMLTDDAPFYLGINYQRPLDEQVWYKCQPVGLNTLGKFMKHMALEAGLPGRKTNHSVRKTTCTQLLHAGISPNEIIQLSGHIQ